MKTRLTRFGIFLMLLLVAACIYSFVNKEMAIFYVLLSIIGIVLLSILAVFFVALAKEGLIQTLLGMPKEIIEKKRSKMEMHKFDLLDLKYEMKKEPIERKMDQLLAKVDAHGETMTQNERDAILAEYRQLESELKEIEENAKKEFEKKFKN